MQFFAGKQVKEVGQKGEDRRWPSFSLSSLLSPPSQAEREK